MLILGIETSCDETAVSVVNATGGLKKPQFKILVNVVSSQVKLHAKYGGIVPSLAKREHQKNIVPILFRALKKSGLLIAKPQSLISKQSANSKHQILNTIFTREPELLARVKKHIVPAKAPKIDAIAVTVGPGLEPALWVGVNFAKALSCLWRRPIIPANHLEGHIYSNWLEATRVNSKNLTSTQFRNRKIEFPAICLIVSGGHTELILMKNYGEYKLLGETRDDAVGEAYDKVARLLGLGFPGGPAIDAIASRLPIANCSGPSSSQRIRASRQSAIKLPRPMLYSNNYDFSFAGLKTAVLYLVRDLQNAAGRSKKLPIPEICAEFQAAAIEVLVSKTLRASRECAVKTIMVSGGVAANFALRAEFAKLKAQEADCKVLFPPLELTGDNAAMIAMAGYIRKQFDKNADAGSVLPNANLRIAEQNNVR